MSVDLPAPLCPTSPTHSPAPTWKSTPLRARTAPKCFSAPFSRTISVFALSMLNDTRLAMRTAMHPLLSLDVGLDRRDSLFLRVFVRGDAAFLDLRQRGLEIILGE